MCYQGLCVPNHYTKYKILNIVQLMCSLFQIIFNLILLCFQRSNSIARSRKLKLLRNPIVGLVCQLCNRVDRPMYKLYNQFYCYHKTRPFKCSTCIMKFHSEESRKSPEKVYTQIVKSLPWTFHCEICEHKSFRNSHMEVHVKIHNEDKRYIFFAWYSFTLWYRLVNWCFTGAFNTYSNFSI